MNKKLLIGVLIVVVVLAAVILIKPKGPTIETPPAGPVVVEETVPTDPAEKAAFDRRKAASACRVAILQSLKDPATAQFTEELDATPWTADEAGDLTFKLAVRANSGAGMVDRLFVCKAHAEGAGWTIANLSEGSGP